GDRCEKRKSRWAASRFDLALRLENRVRFFDRFQGLAALLLFPVLARKAEEARCDLCFVRDQIKRPVSEIDAAGVKKAGRRRGEKRIAMDIIQTFSEALGLIESFDRAVVPFRLDKQISGFQKSADAFLVVL